MDLKACVALVLTSLCSRVALTGCAGLSRIGSRHHCEPGRDARSQLPPDLLSRAGAVFTGPPGGWTHAQVWECCFQSSQVGSSLFTRVGLRFDSSPLPLCQEGPTAAPRLLSPGDGERQSCRSDRGWALPQLHLTARDCFLRPVCKPGLVLPLAAGACCLCVRSLWNESP